MAIYVASSPYRSFTGRRELKVSFPKLAGFFKKRRSLRSATLPRRVAGSGVSGNGVSSAGISARNVATSAAIAVRAAGKVRRFPGLEFGPVSVMVILFVIACLMGLLYLAHFNQVATKGYDLRRLEAARQQLLGQNDIKNMKLADAKSMARVVASNRVSAMKRPSELIYVRGNTALASK